MECCGVLKLKGNYYKIYSDVSGRFYTDDFDIVGLRVNNACEIDYDDVKWKLDVGVYGECFGVILCDDIVIKMTVSGTTYVAYTGDWENKTPFRFADREDIPEVVDIVKNGLTYYELLYDGSRYFYYDDYTGELVEVDST